MLYPITCPVCNKSDQIDLPDIPEAYRATISRHYVYWFIARTKNWAMSQSKDGTFICCPDCYEKCFDLSQGGNVGFLKDEYKHLCVKE